MGSRRNSLTFTDQGRETPATVGAAGERAGPHRPVTASDCPASSVESQAVMQVNATGLDKDRDSFRRKESILRTPPKQRSSSCTVLKKDELENRGRSNSITLMDRSNDVFGEKEGQKLTSNQETKRKRVETPEKEEAPKELQELREAISRLGQSSKILKGLIERNPYTKIEIKQEITTIGRTIEVLTRKCFEWEIYQRQTTQTRIESKKETADKGCQTDPEQTEIDKKNIKASMDLQEKENILRVLEEGKNFEAIAEIVDKGWPEDVYNTVIIDASNPTQANNGWDVALVIDPRNGGKGILKSMGNKYPEILELTSQDIQEGRVEYLQNITKTTTSRKSMEESTKYIFILPQCIDEGGVNDIRVLYQMLIQLQQ